MSPLDVVQVAGALAPAVTIAAPLIAAALVVAVLAAARAGQERR